MQWGKGKKEWVQPHTHLVHIELQQTEVEQSPIAHIDLCDVGNGRLQQFAQHLLQLRWPFEKELHRRSQKLHANLIMWQIEVGLSKFLLNTNKQIHKKNNVRSAYTKEPT